MSLSISLLTLSGTIPVALDNKKKRLFKNRENVRLCVGILWRHLLHQVLHGDLVVPPLVDRLPHLQLDLLAPPCLLQELVQLVAEPKQLRTLWEMVVSCGISIHSILVPLSRLDHGLVERVLGLSVSHLLPIATAGHRAGTASNGFSHGSKQYPRRGGTSDVCPASNEEKNQYVTARGQSICRNP